MQSNYFNRLSMSNAVSGFSKLSKDEKINWIAKEYRQLAKILIPEMKEENSIRRKLKAANIDTQMAKLLEGKKCNCGGEIKQGRSGAKVAYCQNCKQRYVARSK